MSCTCINMTCSCAKNSACVLREAEAQSSGTLGSKAEFQEFAYRGFLITVDSLSASEAVCNLTSATANTTLDHGHTSCAYYLKGTPFLAEYRTQK
eukprot:1144447-Pelagomonas_calceolata.AAC.1